MYLKAIVELKYRAKIYVLSALAVVPVSNPPIADFNGSLSGTRKYQAEK